MGYTTQFRGELRFTSEATASQLAHLQTILGEDRRDHPEWHATDEFYYVDLELTEDFGGLRWDGSEKTYGMVEIVKTVIRLMREKWPDFGLTGRLDAQGEDIGDVWALIADGADVREVKYHMLGREVECPHCENKFVLDPELVEEPKGEE